MNDAAKQTTRRRWLVTLALGILGVYAILSVLDARSASSRLAQAQADLDEVSRKLGEINRLRQAPKVAALQLESPAEIANRVSAARESAGLPQSSLLKEQPLDPARIQRSDFELRATNVELSAATLQQIITFCEALRDEETGTVVRDITLTEPQNDNRGGQEKWESQLVLTQMIFSPKSR